MRVGQDYVTAISVCVCVSVRACVRAFHVPCSPCTLGCIDTSVSKHVREFDEARVVLCDERDVDWEFLRCEEERFKLHGEHPLSGAHVRGSCVETRDEVKKRDERIGVLGCECRDACGIRGWNHTTATSASAHKTP